MTFLTSLGAMEIKVDSTRRALKMVYSGRQSFQKY